MLIEVDMVMRCGHDLSSVITIPGYGKITGLCIQFSGISISRACLTI